MDVAECRPITGWRPIYGDLVICNKFFGSWYGIITNVDQNTEEVELVYAGTMPILFSLSNSEIKKRKRILDIDTIKRDRNYSVQQVYGGKPTWYL